MKQSIARAEARFRKTVLLGGVAAVSLSVIAAAPPALAQDTAPRNDNQLEEVVVTARRVGESLDTVPLAVTAFTAQALEAQAIQDLTDVSRNTPGFTFNQQTGGGSGRNDRSTNALTFRGLALSGGGGLLFLDGAPVVGNVSPPVSEIERIEVLKGPQAVYFGRATFTGAINFVSKDPSLTDYSATVRGDVGTYGSYEGAASVNIPLVQDKLAVRISGTRLFEGGQYHNYADMNQVFGDRSTTALSSQVLFMPTENLKIKGYASITELVDGPAAQGSIVRPNLNCNLGGTSGAYWCGQLPTNIPDAWIGADYKIGPTEYAQLFENNFPVPFDRHWHTKAGLRRQLIHVSLRTDWTFLDDWTLSTISAYHRDKNQNNLDLTFRDTTKIPNFYYGMPNFPTAPQTPKWLLIGQTKLYDWSEELRLTTPQDWRLRGTFGGSYFYTENPASSLLPGITAFGITANGTRTESFVRTPAVFGGLYFDIMENLTLSAEGRYQWDTIASHALTNTSGVFINAQYFKETFTSFSPRAILDWQFRPNSTAYVLFSRAYRPGGFNAALATAPQSTRDQAAALGATSTFDQERLDNYEAGVKSRFWENRASVRLTVYRDLYRKGQVANNILVFNPNGTTNLIGVTQNLGSTNLWGIELEGDVKPMRELTLSGSFGLAESEVITSNCSECVNILNNIKGSIGQKMPNVARIMYTLNASYERPLWGEFNGFARVDYRYRGRMYGDAANIQWSAPGQYADIRIGLRSDNFMIEGYITNLFNDRSTFGFQGPDIVLLPSVGQHVRLGLPELRRAGIRASYDF